MQLQVTLLQLFRVPLFARGRGGDAARRLESVARYALAGSPAAGEAYEAGYEALASLPAPPPPASAAAAAAGAGAARAVKVRSGARTEERQQQQLLLPPQRLLLAPHVR